jgi:hypothetical protein
LIKRKHFVFLLRRIYRAGAHEKASILLKHLLI